MKNIVLLLILLAGLVAGYFVGDYRGRDARRALEEATAAGKELDEKRQQEIVRLNADLDTINRKHAADVAALRQEGEASKAGWEAAKAGLDETIARQKSSAGELTANIARLQDQAGNASGDERKQLEAEIARLQRDLAATRRQLDGNVCLKTPIPSSVFDALRLAEGGEQ